MNEYYWFFAWCIEWYHRSTFGDWAWEWEVSDYVSLNYCIPPTTPTMQHAHVRTHTHTHLPPLWLVPGISLCAPSPPAEPSYLDDSVHMLASEHLTFSLTSNGTLQPLSTFFFFLNYQRRSTGGRFFASELRWVSSSTIPQGEGDAQIKHYAIKTGNFAMINFALSSFLYSSTPCYLFTLYGDS